MILNSPSKEFLRAYSAGPLLAVLLLAACDAAPQADNDARVARSCVTPDSRPVRIEGGSFAMGQENIYREEGPVRQVRVDGFWIDPHEVTNRQFATFVDETGYVTLAEKPVDPDVLGVPVDQIPPDMLKPGSAVFTAPAKPSRNYTDWWEYRPGANWKKPYGPDGAGHKPDEPVVHLAYEDMSAYAAWAGGRMPTEAEWEYAASAGAAPYTQQPKEANSWQGAFPVVNEKSDGFSDIAPVGCYTANANGLYDMIGNVWEATADFYRPGHDPAQTDNPKGPNENDVHHPRDPGVALRVIKGGSYLCAPNYCQRYRPAARSARDVGMGASNVGFRLVYDKAPTP